MTNVALLRVDIQNDFLGNTKVSVKNGNRIIDIVNNLTQSQFFNLVIDIRDCHTPNNKSFAKWGVHCLKDSYGALPPKDLIQKESIKLFNKGQDDFIDALSAFENRDLKPYLLNNQVSALYITGIATEFCVLETAKDAVNNGFDTHIILDACAGFDANINNDPKFLAMLERLKIKAILSENVLKS